MLDCCVILLVLLFTIMIITIFCHYNIMVGASITSFAYIVQCAETLWTLSKQFIIEGCCKLHYKEHAHVTVAIYVKAGGNLNDILVAYWRLCIVFLHFVQTHRYVIARSFITFYHVNQAHRQIVKRRLILRQVLCCWLDCFSEIIMELWLLTL